MIRPVSADGRIETGGVFTPVDRPRVIERIASAAAQRVVLIVAPAGYGKSVALSQYLATVGDELVRYNVQPEHSTLLGFVRGFADALLDVAPDARQTVSEAYEKNQTSKTPGADLAMWMHAHIKSFTGLIAIDDLHVAENDPEISRFLTSLVERTKGRARWIITSRSTLDLPIGSWLAYGEMDLTIDEQDLRFTIEEARHAAKMARVAVRDDELAEILAMTEGWPTALSFALRSSTRSVDLRNITAATREMIYRYLAEQVYRSITDRERELLHFTSYLDEIDLDVLREAGYAQAKAIIEPLRGRVAFIYAERPGIYRCHDLFRDFLQHQLELQGDAAVAAMRSRAARSLESAKRLPAALDMYVQATALSDVLRLLEAHGFELIERGHHDRVQLALSILPHDVTAQNAVVLGIRGLGEAAAGRLDRAESLLQSAMRHSADMQMKARLAIRLALILANQMRDTTALLEPLVEEGLSDNLRGEIISLLAIAYAYAGRPEDTQRAIAQAEFLVRQVDSDQDRARILHRIGIAISRLGLAQDRALSAQTQAAALASEQGMFGLAGLAFSSLASIALFYEGDVTKEIWYAQQAANAAMKAGNRFGIQTAVMQLMDAESRRGNADRLRALEQQLAAVATTDVNRLVYVVPVRAFAAAWDGRFEEAHRLLATVAGNSRFFDFDRTLNSAAAALFLLADQQRERAIALVAQSLPEIEKIESPLPHGQRQNEIARLLCAAVEGLAGRQTSAQRMLQKRKRDLGPAVDAVRDAVVAICRAAKTPALLSDLADRLEVMTTVGYGGLARVLELVADRCIQTGELTAAGLTPAQMQILEALAQGRSPKDIAQESGRSIYTVQVHIHNLIKRLGCRGRHEALSVARNRGLIA